MVSCGKSLTIKKLYDVAPENLECFVHPVFKRRLRFLTDEETVARAKKILRLVMKNDPDIVLYADTGAWPLAFICQSLRSRARSRAPKWLAIKCPREAAGRYEVVIISLLTLSERTACLSKNTAKKLRAFCKERNVPLPTHCEKMRREKLIFFYMDRLNELFSEKLDTPLKATFLTLKNFSETHELYSLILHDTRFTRALRGTVVYLDEYVDSGVTLSNTMNVLRCFNAKTSLRVVAYHVFAFRQDLIGTSVTALHTKDEGVDAFLPGAYPYENRVDIIGRFYVGFKRNFRKVTISALSRQYGNRNFIDKRIKKFLEHCVFFIAEKRVFTGSYVRGEHEVLRYMLFLFEDSLSKTEKTAALLWGLFDMHGPAWSPLPDNYHLDFWNAANAFKKEISALPGFVALTREYRTHRRHILQEVTRLCIKRHKAWKAKIKKLTHV